MTVRCGHIGCDYAADDHENMTHQDRLDAVDEHIRRVHELEEA